MPVELMSTVICWSIAFQTAALIWDIVAKLKVNWKTGYRLCSFVLENDLSDKYWIWNSLFSFPVLGEKDDGY